MKLESHTYVRQIHAYVQDFFVLFEDPHRRVYSSVELSGPGDSAGDWRQIPGRGRLVSQPLVQFSHCLQISTIISQQLLVFLGDVQLSSFYPLKLTQQLQRFLSLRNERKQE